MTDAAAMLADRELSDLARGIALEFEVCNKEGRTTEVLRELAKRLAPTEREQQLAWYDRHVVPHLPDVCATLAAGEDWHSADGNDTIEAPGSPEVQWVLRLAGVELAAARAAADVALRNVRAART